MSRIIHLSLAEQVPCVTLNLLYIYIHILIYFVVFHIGIVNMHFLTHMFFYSLCFPNLARKEEGFVTGLPTAACCIFSHELIIQLSSKSATFYDMTPHVQQFFTISLRDSLVPPRQSRYYTPLRRLWFCVAWTEDPAPHRGRERRHQRPWLASLGQLPP